MTKWVWVCRHDPTGIDPDTATYCPEARRVEYENEQDGRGFGPASSRVADVE